jgi:hypothetical protein
MGPDRMNDGQRDSSQRLHLSQRNGLGASGWGP